MWNRIIAAVVLVGFGGTLVPQDFGYRHDGEEDRFSVYLALADRERTVGEWERLAEAGMAGIDGEKEGALRVIMDRRFREWVRNRIGSVLPESDLYAYVCAMKECRRRLLYTEDPNTGDILRDSAGDPIIDISSPEDTDAAFIQAHLNLKEEALTSWEETARREAENDLGASGIMDSSGFDSIMEEVLEYRRASIDSMYEQIFTRLQSAFLNELLQDTRSLKKKAEERSAKAVGDELFTSIREELIEAEDLLSGGMNGKGMQDPGELERAFGVFEENYRQAFERGLDAWSRSEERLLGSAAAWERSVLEQYGEGEEQWQELFETLRLRRAAWFEEMNRYYRQGLEVFDRQEEEIELQIRNFQDDLVKRRDEETAQKKAEVDQLVSLFRRARQYERLAGETVVFLEEMLSSGEEDKEVLEEDIASWTAIEADQREAAEDAAGMLMELSATALSGYGQVPASGLEMEIEGFKIRLRKLEEQIEIVRGVVDYAENGSSSRPTEAQTRAAYESSIQAAEEALEGYREALGELEAMDVRVEETRGEYERARATADTAAESLAEARSRYEVACERILVPDFAVYEESLETISGELYRLFIDDNGGSGTEYERVLSAFVWESLRQQGDAASEVRDAVTAALTEGTEDGVLSLSECIAVLNGLTECVPDWDNPPDTAEFELMLAQEAGLRPDSPVFISLCGVYDEYAEAPEEMMDYLRRRVEYELDRAARDMAGEIHRRRIGVLYLTGNDDALRDLYQTRASEDSLALLADWDDLPVPNRDDIRDTREQVLLLRLLEQIRGETAAAQEYILLSEDTGEVTGDEVWTPGRFLYETDYFSGVAGAEAYLEDLRMIRGGLETALTDLEGGASLSSLSYLKDNAFREYLNGSRMITLNGFPVIRLFMDRSAEVVRLENTGFFNEFEEMYADLSLLFREDTPCREISPANRRIIDGFCSELNAIENLREAADFIEELPPEPGFYRRCARMYLASKAQQWDTAAEVRALEAEIQEHIRSVAQIESDIEQLEEEAHAELDRLAATEDAVYASMFEGFIGDHTLPEYCRYIDGELDGYLDCLEDQKVFSGLFEREVCRAVYQGYGGAEAARMAAVAAAGRKVEAEGFRLVELETMLAVLNRAKVLAEPSGFHSFCIDHDGEEYLFTLHDAVMQALTSAVEARDPEAVSGYEDPWAAEAEGARLVEELLRCRETLQLMGEYDAAELYEETVLPAEEELSAADEAYDLAMDVVARTLSDLDECLTDSSVCRRRVAGLYDRYREALLGRQQAREILEYAVCGYEDGGTSPQKLLEELLTEYTGVQTSIDTLTSLASGAQEHLIHDEVLASLAGDIERESRELFLYRRLQEILEKKVADNVEMVADANDLMESELQDLFVLPAGYDPAGDYEDTDMSAYTEYTLKELAGMLQDEQCPGLVDAAFLDAWIESLVAGGDQCLKQCMLAYSYEARGTKWDILSPAEYVGEDEEIMRLFDVPGDDSALQRLFEETRNPPVTVEYIYEHTGEEAWNTMCGNAAYAGFRVLMQGGLFRVPIRNLVLQEFREAGYTAALPEVTARMGKAREAAAALSIIASGYAAAGAALIAAVVSIPAGIAMLAQAAMVAGAAVKEKVKASRLQEIIEEVKDYSGITLHDRRGLFDSMAEYISKRDARYALEDELSAVLGGELSGVEEIRDCLTALAAEAGGEVYTDYLQWSDEIGGAVSRVCADHAVFHDLRDVLSRLEDIRREGIRRLNLSYNHRVEEVLADLAEEYIRYRDSFPVEETEPCLPELFVTPPWSREGEYARLLYLAEGLDAYGSDDLEADRLRMLGDSITSGSLLAFDNAANLEYQELMLDLEMFRRRRSRWESRMASIVEEGRAEWDTSLTTALGRHIRWQEEYGTAYREGLEEWKRKTAYFRKRRDEWIQRASEAWVKGEAAAVVLEAEVPETRRIALPDISLPPYPGTAPGDDTGMLVDAGSLDNIMARIRTCTLQGEDVSMVLRSGVPASRAETAVRRKVLEYGRMVRETVTREAAVAAALQMKSALFEALDGLEQGIEKANGSVADSLGSRLFSSGYARVGGYYVRTVAVDESVMGGVESEEQKIGIYEYFEAPEFVPASDLSVSALKHLSSAAVRQRTASAREGLKEYQEMIFGPAGEEDTPGRELNLAETLEEFYASAAEAWSSALASAGEGPEDIPEGLFYFHVGFAPEPPASDESSPVGGYGETGRIYGAFFEQQMQQARGEALLQVPSYDIKLWDDDLDNDGEPDTLMAAPTYRDIMDIATGVAAGVLTGGTGGVLLNLTDDVLFAAADTGNGFDPGQVLLGLGQKAAAGCLGSGAAALGGLAGRSLQDIVNANFAGAVAGLLNTTVDIGTGMAADSIRMYGAALVHALDVAGGSIYFDEKRWEQLSEGIGVSLLSRAVGTGTAGALDNSMFGYHGSLGDGLQGLHRLAGGAAGALVEYELTGETTLNVLNTAGLTDGLLRTGLLEMHLGRESLFGLGNGGLDVSASALVKAADGLRAYAVERELTAAEGIAPAANIPALRALASLKHLPGLGALYSDIISGSVELLFDGAEGAAAYTVASEDGRIIHLADNGAANHAQLLLGVMLAHEAARNGVADGALDQFAETTEAVLYHSMAARSIAGTYGWGYDPSGYLSAESDLVLGSLNTGDYQRLAEYMDGHYDSSEDYWKLVVHTDGSGSVVWDGKRDLTNEAGDLLHADSTGSFSRSLMNILGADYTEVFLRERGLDLSGMDEDELAYALMTGSGVMWDEEAKEYTLIPMVSMTGRDLESLLSFDIDGETAVDLGKISQRSPSIALFADQNGVSENVIRKSGCYYLSTLAAVQTAAGANLSARQIRRLTEIGLREGFLAIDATGIGTSGEFGREGLSRYAFAELGMMGELDFSDSGRDGAIIVGRTINGNNHAREGDVYGNELYDPYSYTSYLPGSETLQMLRFDVRENNDPYYLMYLRYRRYQDMWEA